MLDSFIKLLGGAKPGRVVWTADISYWISGQEQAGQAEPAWDTEEGYLQLHQELGIMPYYYYKRFWLGEAEYTPGVERATVTNGDRTVTQIRTPVGHLTQELVYLPLSCSVGTNKHFIQSEADLDVLQYVIEHRHLVPACLEDYWKRMDLWRRYDGLPSIALPRSPLSSFIYEWAGVERAMYLLMDCENQVAGILRLMEEQEAPVLDAVCQTAPPLVHFADNLSSDTMTGLYDTYMATNHQRRIQRLHASGVRCAVHLDGTVKGLLPKLIRAGFDAVEALTPRPAGDLDVQEIRDIAGSERVILWGGVPGIMFAPPYTWEDMEVHIGQVLRAWQGRPFVLGVADQIPPDGDITFCHRIAEMLD